MKILFVSLFLPQKKAYHAGGRYVAELLRRLSERHEIHLATRFEEGEEEGLKELSPYCARIHPYSYPCLPKRGLFGSLRLVANYLAFSRYANRLIRLGEYDLVQVEWVETALLIGRGKPPMLLDAHDVITKPARRDFERSRGVRRLFTWAKFRLVRAIELSVISRFDRIVTLSEFDRAYLTEMAPKVRVTAVPIPAGLDLKEAVYPRLSRRLLFLASYKYRPTNVEAALWFHREVLPLVRQSVPDTEFVIAGYGPPEALISLEREDPFTRVTGFIDDTDEAYKTATVFVAPILTGGGIIVKVLDALAAGTPVVTTSFGNEGIRAVPGEHLLVGDTAKEFAGHVVSLLKDRQRRERLGACGCAFVTRNFGIDSVLEKLEATYRELLAEKTNRP